MFTFLLALLEVNYNLGEYNFRVVEAVRPILEFRRLLYRDLTNNPYPIQDDVKPEEVKGKSKI